MYYRVDRAFGATHNNDDVYNAIGRPLVNLAARGGTSTLIAYGQTGTGKTYTITGLLQRIGEDLFKELGPGDAVELRVVEILGANATDLMHSVPGAKYVKPEGDEEEKTDKPVRTTKALAEKERRVKAKLAAKAAPPPKNAVFIREDRFSNLQLANARSLVVQDSRHFLGAVQLAFQGRSTAATLKNDTSSRSHACVCLRIISGDRELQQRGQASEGRLYIVDLAGSERASDTSHHDAARLKETKEINKSLMTLKDCIK
ncbi:DSK1, partial [Symbiodinium sp. KB8]